MGRWGAEYGLLRLSVRRADGPSERDLGKALLQKLTLTPPSPQGSSMKAEGHSPCLSKLLIHSGRGCIQITQREQSLNTFCRKRGPGREAHWLDTRDLSRHLISMEKAGFLCYMTGCPVIAMSWSRAPGQEPGQELI